jgi:hypothetical protein
MSPVQQHEAAQRAYAAAVLSARERLQRSEDLYLRIVAITVRKKSA